MWKSASAVFSVRDMPNITLHMPKPLLEAVSRARREYGFNASQVCRDAMQAEMKRLSREAGAYTKESPVLEKLEELCERVSRLEGGGSCE